MQICAERNGWTLFSTMQNHYNLMYREDERELIPVCEQYGVSRIPYSPLAGGHLTHRGWESGTARSNTDKTIRKKYDASKENDLPGRDDDRSCPGLDVGQGGGRPDCRSNQGASFRCRRPCHGFDFEP